MLASLSQVKVGLAAVECFAGMKALTTGLAHVFGADNVRSFELQDDPRQNILTDEGLQMLALWLCSLVPGSFLWLGIPCATWVALSRSSTKRSAFLPFGPDSCTDKVAEHNRINHLCALLVVTASVLGVYFVIEQPLSSLIFVRDFRTAALTVAEAAVRTSAKRYAVFMLSFAGSSAKGLQLVGTAPWLPVLQEVSKQRWPGRNKATERLSTKHIKRDGSEGFTGSQQALTRSSAYTRLFGQAVALCCQNLSLEAILGQLCDSDTAPVGARKRRRQQTQRDTTQHKRRARERR